MNRVTTLTGNRPGPFDDASSEIDDIVAAALDASM
jgi:hypothetical protein